MNRATRILLALISLSGLLAFFVFQDIGLIDPLLPEDLNLRFIVVKSLRFVVNDLLALGLVMAFFPGRGYFLVTVLVQLFGLVFVLIPYLILKVHFGLDNGPLVSFLHRLVLNPVLVLLLLPAFYLQSQAHQPPTEN